MKRYFNAFICALLLLITTNLSSQTTEQTKSFINRTHIAIAKVQKEIYRSGKYDFSEDAKKVIKYQVIAIKLFKENKFKEAIAYSYKSRIQCIELCNKLPVVDNYNLTDDEKTYCFNGSFVTNLSMLSSDEARKIEDLNILDVAKFLEIELNITK
jgi:hypothetical protein